MFSFKKRASGDVPTPGTDKVTVFVDDSGNIKRKDEAGTVEDLASGGIPESIIDAAGDLIVGDGTDSAARLALGTAGQVLTVNAGATAPEWAAAASSGIAESLLDAEGDIIYASAADTAARLAIGSEDDVLTVASGVPTWAPAPSGSSVRGCLSGGYAQVTANQTGIGTGDTDLTGLTVTVDVNSGERIKITAHAAFQKISTTNISFFLIKEGGTLLNEDLATLTTLDYWGAHAEVILTPSAGSHTYKLAARVSSGTLNLEAASTFPAFILVEGIGT